MHVFFSVGEPSGDLHAARLMDELRHSVPALRCSGFGGPRMQSAGLESLYELANLAVMGIVDVVPLLWRFFRLLRTAARHLDSQRPDAVVLVDFPGFNWWIARLAKHRGIPVFYYLPPQLWAWAPWRIGKMRRLVDLVLCGLPFEAAWYRKRNLPVQYVGHPFFDETAEKELAAEFLRQHAPADPATLTVGILPGSRDPEIRRNFDVQLQVMRILADRHAGIRFLVACYRESHRQRCARLAADAGLQANVEFCVGKTAEIVELSSVCLIVSGSVSLELLARQTPAVVLYRVGRGYDLLGRLLLNCPFVTLPNLIAGRQIMPEFVFSGSIERPAREISDILSRWLTVPTARAAVERELTFWTDKAGTPGASRRAADAILARLGGNPAAFRAAA